MKTTKQWALLCLYMIEMNKTPERRAKAIEFNRADLKAFAKEAGHDARS
jgi:hypothetical protein